MARISESELSELKQSIPLLGLIKAQGHVVKKQGKDFVLCCPYHDDETASLVITEQNNLFHCFGCGAAGSVVDWVMKTQGVSFRHAVEILRSDNPSLAAAEKVVKQSTTPKLEAPLSTDTDDQTALRQVIEYYHETLHQSPEALAYLKQRGLDHPELIDTFKLGFANRTLGYRLPQKNRKAGALLRGRLQSVGILRASGHEHFNGSIVIPVINENGEITEVYGRKILNNLRTGTPKHLYLPGAHAGIWNVAGLTFAAQAGLPEVVLCESLIDAMTFWCAGITNVTCSYGTSGFTDEHLETFKANETQRVLIAYDRDDAGNQAADKLAQKLAAAGITPYRVLFPKGMDANEYALKVGPPKKSLAVVIRSAEQMAAVRQSAPAVRQSPSLAASKEINKPEPKKSPENVAEPPASQTQEPPPAVVPKAPVERLAEVNDHEVTLTLGERFYRIRGLYKNQNDDQLKISLLVRSGDDMHVDTLDLYVARSRAQFIVQASAALGVDESLLKSDLGHVLRELELVLADTLAASQTAQPEMTATERQEALAFLRSPDLLERVVTDLKICGLVGEASNKQVAYLGCVSRLLAKPLAILVQSHSAAGKSALLDAVLALVPEEHRMAYSAMSGQSLFYMNDGALQHKVLAIAEEEGVRQASYALKLLQSQGSLVMASTGKDPNTGKLVTEEYRVEGPVMLFLTTTAIDLDEELRNRCLVLTVDEGREQTREIHRLQREQRTLAGLMAKQQSSAIKTLHHNAQRLLRPLPVVNPYADQLTFVDDQMRTRRDHEKYLTLIDVIALLHQYQRPLKHIEHDGQRLEYIEVTRSDIEIANHLAHEVLGRSLDELPPHTRSLLSDLQSYVEGRCKAEKIARSECRFSRSDLRSIGWSYDQLRVHLARLVEMEYVLVHRGGRGQRYIYELLFDGALDQHDPQLMGLIQPDMLAHAAPTMSTNPTLGGEKEHSGAPLDPHWGENGACCEPDKTPAKSVMAGLNGQQSPPLPENARPDSQAVAS